MPRSIFRKVKPALTRSLSFSANACGSRTDGVSAYRRTRSRYLPPSSW